MTERSIVSEELPALPDDLQEAADSRLRAELQSEAVREVGPEVESLTDTLREMRMHNGFGPRLTLAYKMRFAS